jgi:uncharacterized membrane protein
MLVFILEHFFSLVCHQLPDRSPAVHGLIFPLCYRCAGLHLGIFLSFTYLIMTGGLQRRLPPRRRALWLSFCMAPLWIDGWANLLGLWHTSGSLRYLTGLAEGLVIPLLVTPVWQTTQPNTATVEPMTISRSWHLLLLAIGGGGFFLLLITPHTTWLWPALALAAFLGLLFLVSTSVMALAVSLRRMGLLAH